MDKTTATVKNDSFGIKESFDRYLIKAEITEICYDTRLFGIVHTPDSSKSLKGCIAIGERLSARSDTLGKMCYFVLSFL